MTVSTNYEIEFGGVKIADGDKRIITSFAPFESPTIRSSDQLRGQQDGLFPGTDYYGDRTVTLELELWGDDETDFYNAYSQVRNACVLSVEKTLEFKVPGFPENLTMMARCRKVSGLIIDQSFDLQVGKMVLQFTSTDPRLYGVAQSSVTNFVGTQPGRTYNLTFDRNFGGVVASNTINAVNNGNYNAPWSARIDGPVTNPSIEHADLGKIVQLIGTVNTGEYIQVSSPPYSTIMLGGTASRYSWLQNSANWFLLRPGSNNIRFNGTSAGTPTMTLSWKSAWV